MLIKVQLPGDESNEFLIIDNLDDVRFSNQPTIYTDRKSLDEFRIWVGMIDCHKLLDYSGMANYKDGEEYRVNHITGPRKGEQVTVYFDTIAFICTDKGETLEKCYAGGLSHSEPQIADTMQSGV